jgi:hypothetical protein
MMISIGKKINSKSAALLSLIFCLPFMMAFTIAITNIRLLVNLTSYNGRATSFGLILFYVGLLGLLLAFLVNLLSMLTVDLKFTKWSLAGKISLQPKLINIVIATVALLISLVFGGHLIIDTMACFRGYIPACD